MATPHIEAKKEDIANIVIMPGDPLRAKLIAEQWLTDYREVNRVRGMLAYTGIYKGKEITVMGSGMGMGSIGIYSYELYKEYDVEYILRVGSAGSYTDKLKLFDLVLAKECWSESTFGMVQNNSTDAIKKSDDTMNEILIRKAYELDTPLSETRIHSADVFYREGDAGYYRQIYRDHGCSGVEMESFALFHNAQVCGKKAACLLTVSDSFETAERASSKQRQNSFQTMIKLGLEAAVLMGE